MRELKFRVWDKGRKGWLNDQVGTHLWSEYCLNIFTGELVEFITGDGVYYTRNGEPEFYFKGIEGVKESPYIIQQFTGLKDMNGKDIYDGDILHYVFDGASYPKEAIDVFLVCEYESSNAWYVFNKGIKENDGYYWLEISDKCEIVGNIFKNPELLK